MLFEQSPSLHSCTKQLLTKSPLNLHQLINKSPHDLHTPSPLQMNSLTKSLPLYFITALCTALAYLFISVLCQFIRKLLRRQLNLRQRRASNTTTVSTASPLHVDPITRDQLQGHPVLTYSNSDEAEACSVCLADYVAGDEIRMLRNCGHKFHRECVDRWLVMWSSFCPICRERVMVRAEEPGGGEGGGVEEWEYPRRLEVRLEVNVVPRILF